MLSRVTSWPTLHDLNPAVLFGLIVASMVCLSPAVLGDGDTYTHIAAGGWMLDHRTVLMWDPFSSSFGGQPWNAHEWLGELLLAGAYRSGGFSGVVLLTAGAAAAAFGIVAHDIGRRCGWRETMALTAGALVCAIPSLLARPHVLALPLLATWAAGLFAARRAERAPSGWLLVVMLVWANLHGGFAFGLVLALLFAIEATIAKQRAGRWWMFVVVAGLVAMGTPQGWNGLLFPFRLLQLRSLDVIDEWRPVDFSTAVGFDAVLLGLLALLGLSRIRIPMPRAVMLAGLFYMAVAHSRHGVLFGIVGALILAEPVGRMFARTGSKMLRARGWALCSSAVGLMAVLRLATPIADIDSLAAPVSAIARLSPDVARGRVLNSTEFGGYLALSGLHPFVDGRVELFGDAFIAAYRALSRPDGRSLREGVDRYGIDWAILAVNDPLTARFDEQAEWQRLYADRVAVIFVPASSAKAASLENEAALSLETSR